MPADLTPSPQDRTKNSSAPVRSPSCPCCAGPLIVLRGMFRCARCQYTLCMDCEGADAEELESD